ncbi:hypothetical protein I8751_13120 [Nostocaceae cyanobacterium CENA357]|uniref:Uncharacterized protein n=1 Tax=Atlanticothrix silvestris CENA357 TaxID=1725252 RepID=A0A8J7L5P3_9CYAN|nr:hypothetical protein [Atlanticothrix silvestris CENA357]
MIHFSTPSCFHPLARKVFWILKLQGLAVDHPLGFPFCDSALRQLLQVSEAAQRTGSSA